MLKLQAADNPFVAAFWRSDFAASKSCLISEGEVHDPEASRYSANPSASLSVPTIIRRGLANTLDRK